MQNPSLNYLVELPTAFPKENSMSKSLRKEARKVVEDFLQVAAYMTIERAFNDARTPYCGAKFYSSAYGNAEIFFGTDGIFYVPHSIFYSLTDVAVKAMVRFREEKISKKEVYSSTKRMLETHVYWLVLNTLQRLKPATTPVTKPVKNSPNVRWKTAKKIQRPPSDLH